MNFKLNIQGVDGIYTATLTADAQFVAEKTGFKDIRKIRNWAAAEAAAYKAENKASTLESYTSSFQL